MIMKRSGPGSPTELAMLRDAHDHRVPVLGICFGGQLLAAAHGGSVSRSAAPEIGWVDIDSDDESLVPSGIAGSNGTTTSGSCQRQRRRWRATPGPHRPFVLGRNLAVQFHPEMNSEILASWIATGGADEIDRFGITPRRPRTPNRGT